MFERVLKIPIDCSPASKNRGDVVIDGAKYSSADALNHCLKRNLIDTSLTLKKVYIHRITDNRLDVNVLNYMSDEGLNSFYAPRFSLEELYYLFLQSELKSRGIIVLDEPSPASIRLDFEVRTLIGSYHPSNRILELGMGGKLSLNGSRVNRQRDIVSTAKVTSCGVGCDMDFFTSLLIKQAAIKSADEVSQIGR
ncbi:outer membrane lipoprotein MapA [Campylobacter sp. 19-13652]|nr:outer membrane lipoprotein MapA [Campylobacter sp. 19-13652]